MGRAGAALLAALITAFVAGLFIVNEPYHVGREEKDIYLALFCGPVSETQYDMVVHSYALCPTDSGQTR